jgi:ABC-2 type transport system permease protein
MSKLWLVALYEYKRHVLKPSFILVVLSMPLVVVGMIGLIWLTHVLRDDGASAVGYVDYSGLLADAVLPPRTGSSPDEPSVPGLVPLVPYQTQGEAQQALVSGAIQAYYVIAADYSTSNRVNLVYFEPPDGDVTREFWDFMQINRLTDLSPDIARRAVAGANLIVRWPDDAPGGGREFSQRTFWNQFLPLFVGLGFMFLLFMSSGYLMGTLAEEKGHRTVEVLFTSLSPAKLIGGKVVAVVGVSFTQLLAWVVFAILAVLVGGRLLGLEALQNLSLDLRIVAPLTVVFIPAYVMFAGLMAAFGATFADAQDAQGLVGISVLLSMVPIWLIQPIIEHSSGALAIALSLFPTTALPTLSMRTAFGQVPLWQLGASTAILVVCAVGAVWLAGRAFRLGMLRYGQNLDWRELVGKHG